MNIEAHEKFEAEMRELVRIPEEIIDEFDRLLVQLDAGFCNHFVIQAQRFKLTKVVRGLTIAQIKFLIPYGVPFNPRDNLDKNRKVWKNFLCENPRICLGETTKEVITHIVRASQAHIALMTRQSSRTHSAIQSDNEHLPALEFLN